MGRQAFLHLRRTAQDALRGAAIVIDAPAGVTENTPARP
jgi:hypothetical protein